MVMTLQSVFQKIVLAFRLYGDDHKGTAMALCGQLLLEPFAVDLGKPYTNIAVWELVHFPPKMLNGKTLNYWENEVTARFGNQSKATEILKNLRKLSHHRIYAFDKDNIPKFNQLPITKMKDDAIKLGKKPLREMEPDFESDDTNNRPYTPPPKRRCRREASVAKMLAAHSSIISNHAKDFVLPKEVCEFYNIFSRHSDYESLLSSNTSKAYGCEKVENRHVKQLWECVCAIGEISEDQARLAANAIMVNDIYCRLQSIVTSHSNEKNGHDYFSLLYTFSQVCLDLATAGIDEELLSDTQKEAALRVAKSVPNESAWRKYGGLCTWPHDFEPGTSYSSRQRYVNEEPQSLQAQHGS